MFEPSLELSLEPLFEPPLDSPVKAATGRALARRAGVEAARRTEGEVDVEFEGLAEKGAADVPTALLLFVADDADNRSARYGTGHRQGSRFLNLI